MMSRRSAGLPPWLLRLVGTVCLGTVCLGTACLGTGCGQARGTPFGYSHHPLTPAQIQALLGDYPNPGPNISSIMRDTAGNIVAPPLDWRAFASELVIFEPGRPQAILEGSNPREALGMPNYTTNIWEPPHAVSLGNGGAIVLKLVGDPLMDVPGPDLFVFESGPSPEAVSIEISADGETWISVGDVPGGASALDIGPFVKPEDTFRYIRLRDVINSGGDSDPWPGAEIDAVAAARSKPAPVVVSPPPPERITIATEVLFAFDSDTLQASAPAELDRVIEKLAARPTARLSIEGHTDDVGETDYNLALSERRAQAVKAYLVQKGILASRIDARGLGESRPIVPNDSDEGRRKNRRVELVLASD